MENLNIAIAYLTGEIYCDTVNLPMLQLLRIGV
jgi:hypothetical protein